MVENQNNSLKIIPKDNKCLIEKLRNEIIKLEDNKKTLIDSEENLKIIIDKLIKESEKRSEITNMSTGIANEFNNILATIKSTTRLLLHEESLGKTTFDKRIKDQLLIIDRQTNRGVEIVSSLVLFPKSNTIEKEYIFIEDVIEDVLKLQKIQIEMDNIYIVKKYNNKYKLVLNTGQIQQFFLNLLINSWHAIKPKGKGTIVITTESDSKDVIVTFGDDGIGMTDEIKNNIFKPFCTSKGANFKDDSGLKGTDHGLSILSRIIKDHNGSISIDSEQSEGTFFKIIFPIKTSNTRESLK